MNKTNSSQKLIAVFISTHETLTAEKFLKKRDLPFRPVLKPRSISSNCQMGLEFHRQYLPVFLDIAEQNRLNMTGVYENTETGWNRKEV